MMKKKSIGTGTAVLLTAAVLYGCAGNSIPAGTEHSAEAQETSASEAAETLGAEDAAETLAVIEDEAVPLYQKPAGSDVRTPVASGSVTYGNGRATIDASNTSNGYVMIKYTGGQSRIKIQIAKSTTYTYDLNAQVMSQDISVSLADKFAPFLTPNQYVNFSSGSAAVNKGAELAASAADAIGVVTNVYNYVIKNITYDTAKATSVQSGYLPNVDQVLAQRTGICFDYAALMTAMLRSQDIPTKLVIGYSGGLYHAWVNVYIDNVGWIDNFIYFDGHDWSLMDPTFASSGGQSESIKQYIGNGANYQAKYTY